MLPHNGLKPEAQLVERSTFELLNALARNAEHGTDLSVAHAADRLVVHRTHPASVHPLSNRNVRSVAADV